MELHKTATAITRKGCPGNVRHEDASLAGAAVFGNTGSTTLNGATTFGGTTKFMLYLRSAGKIIFDSKTPGSSIKLSADTGVKLSGAMAIAGVRYAATLTSKYTIAAGKGKFSAAGIKVSPIDGIIKVPLSKLRLVLTRHCGFSG
ncbi:MAG: hypothetical protein LBO04_04950 [Spirochaetaceae bacterium]|nr:hypothetical protein [Spirochaetaceae bacterium]